MTWALSACWMWWFHSTFCGSYMLPMPSSFSHLQDAFFGERDGAVLFVDGEVAGGVLLARLFAFDHFAADRGAE